MKPGLPQEEWYSLKDRSKEPESDVEKRKLSKNWDGNLYFSIENNTSNKTYMEK